MNSNFWFVCLLPAKKAAKTAGAGKRTKKDKDAPKRGKTAYIFFTQEKRDEVKAQNPNIGFTEISTVIAGMWNKLTDAQKKKYNDMAARDKERYTQEMQKYQAKSK